MELGPPPMTLPVQLSGLRPQLKQHCYNTATKTSLVLAAGDPPTTTIIQSSAIMSLDPPAYLFTIQANIRTRPISWEGAMRAKTITDADLQKIKSIDKVRKEERKNKVEGDVQSFVTLLLGGNGSQSIFEAAAKRQDIVQYMLVLTEDLINGVDDRYAI